MTVNHHLQIYVNDHRAGATGGLALARRCLENNRLTELGDDLRRIVSEIEEDAETLSDIAHELAIPPNPLKRAMAAVGERIARLKLNGHLRGYSPLGRLLELEALLAGIDAKRSLWRALACSGVASQLTRFDLDALERRATEQREVLRPHHCRAAEAAFGVAMAAR